MIVLVLMIILFGDIEATIDESWWLRLWRYL